MKEKVEQPMQPRNEILLELLGYFRRGGESIEGGQVTCIRYLMIIAMEYQKGGARAAEHAMNVANMPTRYKAALMETLEKDCS